MKTALNLSDEIWKPIDGYPNYEVSSLGRIKSKARAVIKPRGTVLLKERILKGYYSGDRGRGWCVGLTASNGICKAETIARLMLSAFVRLPKEGEVARHLDDDNKNQSLGNLAWGYPKDNTADALKNGKMWVGSKCNFSKFTEKQVLEIRKQYIPKDSEFGIYSLSKKYGVDIGTISMIVNRRTWKHI